MPTRPSAPPAAPEPNQNPVVPPEDEPEDDPPTFSELLRRAAIHHGGPAAQDILTSLTPRRYTTTAEWDTDHDTDWRDRSIDRHQIWVTACQWANKNRPPQQHRAVEIIWPTDRALATGRLASATHALHDGRDIAAIHHTQAALNLMNPDTAPHQRPIELDRLAACTAGTPTGDAMIAALEATA